MQSIRDIGTTPYEPAPRGESLRKLRNGNSTGRNSGLDSLKFAFSIVLDCLTFVVMVIPILVRYAVGIFVPQQRKKINGQLALVTGGANGLGREICLQLAQQGCHVAVNDLDATNGEKTADDLRKLGVKSKFFKADISSFDAVQGLRKEIESSLGHVDILVNNAGVLPLMSIREGKPEDIQKVLEINLLSHFWTLRTFIDGMVARRKGHIVAIASATSYLPVGRLVSYVASKYGVRGLMEALNDEMYFDGLQNEIHTTTVFPCFMNTRKEVITTLQKLDILSRVPIFSTRRMARAIISGMQRNHRHVFMPKYLGPFLTHYETIPVEIRRVAAKLLLQNKGVPKLMD
ncbi:17-beta-hydroxysteroid dehydrogenase 13-like isoform X2 [Ochlerotatus camptorhynchus]|uniref:17-beta-hydroxysteroid dehydrogenase 13-like isoform X2 n=1 Tax=Ochlerotatus camptorhynchus TaxID=644619 RepID=UPI0031D159C5